jgi:hypothetical protein
LNLFYKYRDVYFEDVNNNRNKRINFLYYIQRAAKCFFALGLYKLLAKTPQSLSDEKLNKLALYLFHHNPWNEAFNIFDYPDLEDELDIEKRIFDYQRELINDFWDELNNNDYLTIYLRQYYSIGCNFGNKMIMGL